MGELLLLVVCVGIVPKAAKFHVSNLTPSVQHVSWLAGWLEDRYQPGYVNKEEVGRSNHHPTTTIITISMQCERARP